MEYLLTVKVDPGTTSAQLKSLVNSAAGFEVTAIHTVLPEQDIDDGSDFDVVWYQVVAAEVAEKA
jgi:hypothetical protein